MLHHLFHHSYGICHQPSESHVSFILDNFLLVPTADCRYSIILQKITRKRTKLHIILGPCDRFSSSDVYMLGQGIRVVEIFDPCVGQ